MCFAVRVCLCSTKGNAQRPKSECRKCRTRCPNEIRMVERQIQPGFVVQQQQEVRGSFCERKHACSTISNVPPRPSGAIQGEVHQGHGPVGCPDRKRCCGWRENNVSWQKRTTVSSLSMAIAIYRPADCEITLTYGMRMTAIQTRKIPRGCARNP